MGWRLRAAALAAFMILGRRAAELRQGREAAASRHWGGSSGHPTTATTSDVDLHLGYLLNPTAGRVKHFTLQQLHQNNNAAPGAAPAPRNGSASSKDALLGAGAGESAAAALVRAISAWNRPAVC